MANYWQIKQKVILGNNAYIFWPSFVLIEDYQRGDDAQHPADDGEQKHDEHRTATAVDHLQGRKDDGWDDLEAGYNGLLFFRFL